MDKLPFCGLCYDPKMEHPTAKCLLITDQDKLVRVRQTNYLNMIKNRGNVSSNGRPSAKENKERRSRGGYEGGWTERGG